MGFWQSTFGGGPGNAARARREQEIRDRQLLEERTTDPYGPDAPQWDENGFPVGPMPRGKFALDYQYEANRRAEARRRALWGDAQQSFRQGLDLLQSYRPGGAAAIASGMFGQKASLYGTEALNVEAPDLLIDWREQIRQRAEENTNKLNRNAQLITGLSAFNVLGGGTVAQLASQPATPQAPESQGGGVVPASPAGSMQGDPGSSMFGGGQTPPQGLQPGTASSQLATEPAQAAPQGRGMGGGGGSMVDPGGGGGGDGGPLGVGGGRGGGGGGARRVTAGSLGGGDGGQAQAGAGQGGGGFSGQETASRALAQSPAGLETATSLWSEDPYREQSTALMVSGSRKRLLAAMVL